MVDRYAFNPGRVPGADSFQFHATPQRLMAADLHVILVGGNAVGDTLRILIDRSKQLNLLAVDFATQWHRDGKAIPWENGRTYTLREEDRGHVIGCWITDAKKLDSELVCVE